jgi:uncharacterized damage-inducible protein DinB
MNVEDFLQLYDYNAWANRRTLEACAPLTDEQFARDLGGGFASVRDTLLHIMLVEWVWPERWHGRSPDKIPSVANEFLSVQSLHARWREIERDLLRYIAELKPHDLERIVHHKNLSGVPQAQPLWQMMQHLVNHGSYHRGQVSLKLRQLGAKPNGTDLIAFYRERAAVAQP